MRIVSSYCLSRRQPSWFGGLRSWRVLLFNGFNHKKSPFFATVLAALRLIAMPHSPFADRSQSSSLVNIFGAEGWLTIGGAEGLDVASQGVTLVLQASWFNHSS
ncbi:hypothetical protein BHE74_00014020 [Ensete ventricosum]|nr:hypothetical protein BHE74_00014020 [Ensete ventricosum]